MKPILTAINEPVTADRSDGESFPLHESFYQMLMQAPVAIVVFSGPDYIIEFANDLYLPIAGKSREELQNKPALEVMPAAAAEGFIERLDKIRAGGQPVKLDAHKTTIARNGKLETTFLNIVYQPLKEPDNSVNRVMIFVTEVTDQVVSKLRLEESESRFGAAVQAVQGILWTNNAKGEMEGEQPGWSQLTGQSFEEYQGYGWSKVVHPDDAPPTIHAWSEAVRDKTTFVFEHRLKKKDGTWGVFSIRAIPLVNSDGIIREWVGVHTDITEQRKAESALRESELQFRSTFENAAVGIAHIGLDGSWLFLNNRIAEILGYNIDELSHLTFKDITHPEDLDTDLNYIVQLLEGTIITYTMEKRYLRKGGTIIWANLTVSLVQDSAGQPMHFISILENISERKKAEKDLRDSEEKMRLFINHAPASVAMFDKNMHYIAVSMRWLQDYKITHSIIGKSYYKVFPDVPQRWKDSHSRSLNGAVERSEEDCFDRSDGSKVWLKWEVRPWYSSTGEIGGVVVFSEDITARKEAEEHIKESESRFRSLANDTPAFMFMGDAEANVEFVNRQWLEFVGLDSAEGMGKAWETITHPDDIAPMYATYSKAVSELTPYQFEIRQKRKDGIYRWVLWSGIPRKTAEGTFGGVMGVGFDITVQKEAEEVIRKSEERFRQLANLVPQILWTAKPDGFVDYYNKRWYEYTGFSEQAFGDQSWAPVVHPEDQQLVKDAWYNSVRQGLPYQFEFRLKGAQKEHRWFLSKAIPVKDNDGVITRWFGTCTDIHDQKTSTERLEALVVERTKELQRSNEDLQRFAHVASHDLKEPVRKVLTFSSLLKEELGNDLSEKAKSFMAKIESSTTRMYSMIDGVLLYSTLNAFEQTKEFVDLNVVTDTIVEDLEISINQKNATIQYEGLPRVEGSQILLYQLFYNLINNSLKFCKPDVPVRIHICSTNATREELIKKNLDPTKDYFKITVQDNGIGFSKEEAETIFGTFVRLNSKDKYEGTGLGLALCKTIVERHGGYIEAEGKEKKGAAFRVFLPMTIS